MSERVVSQMSRFLLSLTGIAVLLAVSVVAQTQTATTDTAAPADLSALRPLQADDGFQ